MGRRVRERKGVRLLLHFRRVAIPLPLLQALVQAVVSDKPATTLPRLETALRETKQHLPHLVSLWTEASRWRPARHTTKVTPKACATPERVDKSPPQVSAPNPTSSSPTPTLLSSRLRLASTLASPLFSTTSPSPPVSLIPPPPASSPNPNPTPPSHSISLPPSSATISSPPSPARSSRPSSPRPLSNPQPAIAPPSQIPASKPVSPSSTLSPTISKIVQIFDGGGCKEASPPKPPKPIFASVGGFLAAAEAAAIARMQAELDLHQQRKKEPTRIARTGPRRARTAADRSASRPVTRSHRQRPAWLEDYVEDPGFHASPQRQLFSDA